MFSLLSPWLKLDMQTDKCSDAGWAVRCYRVVQISLEKSKTANGSPHTSLSSDKIKER